MENHIQNRLTIIAGILAVILGFFIVKENASSFLQSRSTKPYAQITKNEITDLEIYYKNDRTVLHRDSNEWIVISPHRYRANQNHVDITLTHILELNKSQIVSTNKDKQRIFNISDKNKVVFKAKGIDYRVYFSPIQDAVGYVRFENENEIYQVDDISALYTPMDYRDLDISAIESLSDVKEATITYNDTNLHLKQKDTKWYINDNQVLYERVQAILTDLQQLVAADVKQTKPPTIPEDLTIQIKEKDKLTDLKFYKNDSGDYDLYITGRPDMYTVKAIYADSFKKNQEDFTK